METLGYVILLAGGGIATWLASQRSKEEKEKDLTFLFNTKIEEVEQAELPNCEDGRNAGYYAARTVLQLAERMGIKGVRSEMVEREKENN